MRQLRGKDQDGQRIHKPRTHRAGDEAHQHAQLHQPKRHLHGPGQQPGCQQVAQPVRLHQRRGHQCYRARSGRHHGGPPAGESNHQADDKRGKEPHRRIHARHEGESDDLGMSANVATAPASSSRGMLGAHSARRRVRVEGFLRCALQKTKHARRRVARNFRSKQALALIHQAPIAANTIAIGYRGSYRGWRPGARTDSALFRARSPTSGHRARAAPPRWWRPPSRIA